MNFKCSVNDCLLESGCDKNVSTLLESTKKSSNFLTFERGGPLAGAGGGPVRRIVIIITVAVSIRRDSRTVAGVCVWPGLASPRRNEIAVAVLRHCARAQQTRRMAPRSPLSFTSGAMSVGRSVAVGRGIECNAPPPFRVTFAEKPQQQQQQRTLLLGSHDSINAAAADDDDDIMRCDSSRASAHAPSCANKGSLLHVPVTAPHQPLSWLDSRPRGLPAGPRGQPASQSRRYDL